MPMNSQKARSSRFCLGLISSEVISFMSPLCVIVCEALMKTYGIASSLQQWLLIPTASFSASSRLAAQNARCSSMIAFSSTE